jgi:hypothetical protein
LYGNVETPADLTAGKDKGKTKAKKLWPQPDLTELWAQPALLHKGSGRRWKHLDHCTQKLCGREKAVDGSWIDV